MDPPLLKAVAKQAGINKAAGGPAANERELKGNPWCQFVFLRGCNVTKNHSRQFAVATYSRQLAFIFSNSASKSSDRLA
jgi:hypothetical protein